MTPPAEDSNDRDLPEGAMNVISSLYETVIEGAPYEPMFFAMDSVINELLTDTDPDQSLAGLAPLFSPHFDRAAHVFDIMSRNETQTPLNFVEQQRHPAVVVAPSGQIVASNRRFDALPSAPWTDGLGPLFATPADETQFATLAQANDPAGQAILSLSLPGDDRLVSVLAGRVPGETAGRDGAPLLYILVIQPRWTEKTGALLQKAYGLTGAEIETLESFVACGSVKGIADRRMRSIRTVRTQLSRIFSQMGIAGQTELALFLATLSGMEPVTHTPIRGPETEGSKTERLVSHVATIYGTRIEYLTYGAPTGKPVLLLQSSHPPELTQVLRSALYAAGLRLIAPLKPGSGLSDAITGRPGPEALVPLYAALLDSLKIDRVVLAGQASGGLYALAFAKDFADRVASLCLIDTGVPFRNRKELTALPKVMRRTMVPARYFPDLLYLPHRLVAANFHRSPRGEESVVDYFFTGSPIDQEMTRTDRSAYDVTRRIIAYSFDDTDRLVEDISRWASDWSDLLEVVAESHPVRFVHGAENTMFREERIADFVAARPLASLSAIEGAGQLAVFADPVRLASALAELAEHL